MIRLLGSAKHLTAVAVSGGVDSMAALSFLRQSNPVIKAVYFHHGTDHGEDAFKFLTGFCSENAVPLLVGRISSSKTKDESWEEYWRNQRYGYLHSLPEQLATAHHLNDAAETYMMGFIRGRPKLIPYHRVPNIFRPFLLTARTELVAWCQRHSVPWIEDPSNEDTHYDRNRVRHKILPEVMAMNPGFLRTVARQLKETHDKHRIGDP